MVNKDDHRDAAWGCRCDRQFHVDVFTVTSGPPPDKMNQPAPHHVDERGECDICVSGQSSPPLKSRTPIWVTRCRLVRYRRGVGPRRVKLRSASVQIRGVTSSVNQGRRITDNAHVAGHAPVIMIVQQHGRGRGDQTDGRWPESCSAIPGPHTVMAWAALSAMPKSCS